jgi:hypothetical protein
MHQGNSIGCVLGLGLAACLGASCLAEAAQPTPPAAVACYFVGRGFFDSTEQPETTETFGYFTDITGIAGPLFGGVPGEGSAFFTYRSDVLKVTPVPTNGDVALALFSAGTVGVYFNPAPMGDWGKPDTFSSGQLIARLSLPESLLIQTQTYSRITLTGTLVASQRFSFNGKTYDVRSLVPHGVTFDDSISNTGVPGVSGFPIGIAYAGNCLAVGSNKGDD